MGSNCVQASCCAKSKAKASEKNIECSICDQAINQTCPTNVAAAANNAVAVATNDSAAANNVAAVATNDSTVATNDSTVATNAVAVATNDSTGTAHAELTVDQKLDKILALLEANESVMDKYEAEIKKEITDFMLKHLNISWLDDTVESNVYGAIISVVFSIIKKYI